MDYALYKFRKAVNALQDHASRPRDWLRSSHLHHIVSLRDDDLPPQGRAGMHVLRRLLGIDGAGTVSASLDRAARDLSAEDVQTVIDTVKMLLAILDADTGVPDSGRGAFAGHAGRDNGSQPGHGH